MRVIVVIAFALLMAACTSSVSLDPAKPSDIEGVPIPGTAQVPTVSAKDTEAVAQFYALLKRPRQVQSVAYNVPGSTFSRLEQWYDARMPDGRAWSGISGNWLWCDGKHWHNDTPYFWKDYHIPAKRLTMTVRGDDGTPPFIIIAKTTNAVCERD